MNFSVIIPVYNSEASIGQLVDRLQPVLNRYNCEYELIFVNDGSHDNSWQTICHLKDRYPWIKGINLMKNFGQHNALLCGIRAAIYDTIITMDDDLQHPPEEIPKLIEELNKGYDVVYGSPLREPHGIWRAFTSKLIKWTLFTVMKTREALHVSAFRVFRTRVRNAFAEYQSPYVSIDVLLSWGTDRFTAVTVNHDARHSGISNYTLRKLMGHALNMITGFSTIPLRIASLLGFIFMFFGFLILCMVILTFLLYGRVVPGFSFLASIIVIFSGVQLFVIGIIGEYLARIHFRTFNKPPYVIKSGYQYLQKTGDE